MRALASLFRSQRGQNAIEGLFAIAILAVVAQSTALVLRSLSRHNVSDNDRVFASEKAIEMLEELRSMTMDQSVKVDILDQMSDMTITAASNMTPLYRFTLTTKVGVYVPGGNTPDAVAARHTSSGNPTGSNGYRFVRNVIIDKSTNVRNPATERFVRVRIFYADANGGLTHSGPPVPREPTRAPVAEVAGLVSTSGDLNRPTQEMDYYLIALENVPGWWSRTTTLAPLMTSSLLTLRARNPGLKFRTHWIKRMSYGRDLEYTPEINEAMEAKTAGSLKKAYVYPGKHTLVTGEVTSLFDMFTSQGRLWHSLSAGGHELINPKSGYAMADQFNHAMRYPDELRLYQAYKAIAANTPGAETPEPSLRMLLENLISGSADWRNSILINLHGEMLPIPPLRNVSDAAKDPGYFYRCVTCGGRTTDAFGNTNTVNRAFRAVTHPERLYYSSDVTALANPVLRVYAYDLSPTTIVDTSSATVPAAVKVGSNWFSTENDLIDVVTLFVPDASVNNLSSVARVQGNSHTPYYKWVYGPGDNNDLGQWPAGGDDPSWVADDYSTPDGRSGLRLRLYGVTPTARAYYGAPFAP